MGIGIFLWFYLIVFNFWSGRKNHMRRKLLTWNSDFAFHGGNHIDICRMPMWVRKTAFFFPTFFQKQASKSHLAQGNLSKTMLWNEKQSNLEKEMYENISLYSKYFSPGEGSNVCILLLLKINQKVFYFIFLDQKSSI